MLDDWFSSLPEDAPWEPWFAEVSSADVHPFHGNIPRDAGLFADGLSALLGVYFKPTEQPPFGPMAVFEGRRSLDICDIPVASTLTLSDFAKRFDQHSLRARLADIAWEVDKSNADAADVAFSAYCAVIESVLTGALSHSFDDGGVTHRTCELVIRAASIARQTGDSDRKAKVSSIADKVFEAAMKAKSARAASLRLGSRYSLLSNLSQCSERVLEAARSESDLFGARDLCLEARVGFRVEKDKEQEAASAVAASEFAEQIASSSPSSMFASTWLQSSLDDLAGVPNQKARKRALYTKLVEVQESVTDEMQTVEHSQDISEIVEAVEKDFAGLKGIEFLKLLFSICHPEPVEQLVRSAEELSAQFPLSRMFAPQLLDAEGRVIAKQPKKDHPFGVPADLLHSIFQDMERRSHFVAVAQINTARRLIASTEAAYDTELGKLFTQSPFVPRSHQHKFATALTNFLHGQDLIAAALLVPIFEDCLRKVLKAQGVDTSVRDANGIQKLATLSKLFDAYREELSIVFGRDWVFEAEALFTHDLGARLRHNWTHGLVSDGVAYGAGVTYANWFILKLALVPVLFYDQFVSDED